MKILLIITSSPLGTWLTEVTRPFWHFTDRGHEITFASPGGGGAVVWAVSAIQRRRVRSRGMIS